VVRLSSREELERSTDVFTIELIDMKQHHRVLWGDDVIQGLQIPMRLHRVQVEYELREKLILLRQHLLLAGDDKRRIRELLHAVEIVSGYLDAVEKVTAAVDGIVAPNAPFITNAEACFLGRRERRDRPDQQVNFSSPTAVPQANPQPAPAR